MPALIAAREGEPEQPAPAGPAEQETQYTDSAMNALSYFQSIFASGGAAPAAAAASYPSPSIAYNTFTPNPREMPPVPHMKTVVRTAHAEGFLKLPAADVKKCEAIHKLREELIAERAKIDLQRVAEVYFRNQNEKAQRIAAGLDKTESLDGVTLDSTRAEMKAKADVIDMSIRKLCDSAHPHLDSIMAAVVDGLKKFADKVEREENAHHAEWGLQDQCSAIVGMVRHVLDYAEQCNCGQYGVNASPISILGRWSVDHFDKK